MKKNKNKICQQALGVLKSNEKQPENSSIQPYNSKKILIPEVM